MTIPWPIAVITVKEGVRNRAFYGITLIALMLSLANYLISGMIPQEVGKVSVDIALSTVSFAGLLLVFFVGINLITKDLDRRTIYIVLSRPVSRSQYVIGKFIGMALLIIAVVLCLSIFTTATIWLLKVSYPGYFPRFSWNMVLLAISFITLSLVLLSAVSFFFASFTSSSFLTLILTMISYVIGQSLNDVKALVEGPSAAGIVPSPVIVKLVQTAYYLFPNLSLFDIKTQAAHSLPLAPSYIFWTAIYGLVYTVLVISAAAFLFRKKELP